MSGCHEPVNPRPLLLAETFGLSWLVQSQKSGSMAFFGWFRHLAVQYFVNQVASPLCALYQDSDFFAWYLRPARVARHAGGKSLLQHMQICTQPWKDGCRTEMLPMRTSRSADSERFCGNPKIRPSMGDSPKTRR
jgi:hypothetical protein